MCYDFYLTRYREHLLRRHLTPIHCQRCYKQFGTISDLQVHEQFLDACGSRKGEKPEGITPKIEKVLRSRKKSGLEESTEKRWEEIYSLLFPGENVLSPCE
jgi:hypothetical protein